MFDEQCGSVCVERGAVSILPEGVDGANVLKCDFF